MALSTGFLCISVLCAAWAYIRMRRAQNAIK